MPQKGSIMQKAKQGAVRATREMRSVFPYSESVTVWGQERVTAQGCKRILTYTATCIRLRLRQTVLAVRGSGLCCVSFSCGTATLCGRIQSVCFEDAQEVRR